MNMHHPGVTEFAITSVTRDESTVESDEVAVEEPLQIEICLPRQDRTIGRPLAVTMRTPGHDAELAAGFLFTEGIVRNAGEIVDLQLRAQNVMLATLHPAVQVDPAQFERHSFVSSSCGVCGKRSIAAVFAIQRYRLPRGRPRIDSEVVHALPRTQRAAQSNFQRTGGLHAAALFDPAGTLLGVYEDVGRHNALDKLIGAEMLAGRTPLTDRIGLVSGRASFELVQKASVAGLAVLAAVGAPSSLAVTLARQSEMTLLGFVRDGRYNIYADAGRIAVDSHRLMESVTD